MRISLSCHICDELGVRQETNLQELVVCAFDDPGGVYV